MYDHVSRRDPVEYEQSAILQLLITQMYVAQSEIEDWRDVIPENFEDVGETLGQTDETKTGDDGN